MNSEPSLRRISRLATCLMVALLIAGCGSVVPNATPSRTPRVVMTLAPASQPLVPPASASPGASALPEERAVIAAFVSNFALRQPSFHLESDALVTGSSGGESTEFEIAVTMDVDGGDFDGKVVVRDFAVRVRLVDGIAYGRMTGRRWVVVQDFDQTQPLNPFSLLDPVDLEYVGMREGRRAVHQLRTTKWIGPDPDDIGMSDMKIDSSVFDIFVGKKGVPVDAHLEFAISGRMAGRATVLSYRVEYRFSDVGKPVEIRAPI